MSRVPIDLTPNRWGSQPYPPPGYLSRWARNIGLWRGYPESDGGFDIVSQIVDSSASKAGASWNHSHTDATRWVIGYYNQSIYYWNDSVWTSILGSLTETYCPSFACMGLPLGASLFVNGADSPKLIREASGVPEGVAANFEAPNTNFSLTQGTGGSLADGVYTVRIAQVEVHATTGTIISAPSSTKTITISAGGGTAKITVAQNTWTPNARATHWRIGITDTDVADSPSAYFWSGSNIAIGTTSSDITQINAGGLYTSTAPFESRNGFYATTDLTEIISGKHPRGVCVYEGRWVVWYKNDNRILWSERDSWLWYSTNSLDTGAEGGWNLPVLCCLPMNGFLLVFTADAIHGVFGDFSRDLDGAAPNYAANAIPKTLVTGTGMVGGCEAAKNVDGVVPFSSTRGPAVFTGGGVTLLAPEDIRHERSFWDTTYADRWIVCEDSRSGDIIFAPTRKTNSSRPMDGASAAGLIDTLYRWIPSRGVWDCPLQMDVTHLSARTNGAAGAAHQQPVLMAVGPHGGAVSQLGVGHSGGVPSCGGAAYDGILASANNTTTATIALAGIAADELNGQTVTLRYPSGDSTYPYVQVQKTISDNTATSGGNVTITWVGAVTAPTTSFWTVRIAGLKRCARVSLDPRALGVGAPDSYYQLHEIEARFKDRVGAEAIS